MMNTIKCALLCSFLLGCGGSSDTTTTPDTSTNSAVEGCVDINGVNNFDPVTVTDLSCTNDIINLERFQNYSSLESLSIETNEFESFSGIEALNNLQAFNLIVSSSRADLNQLDFSAFLSLTNLRELEFEFLSDNYDVTQLDTIKQLDNILSLKLRVPKFNVTDFNQINQLQILELNAIELVNAFELAELDNLLELTLVDTEVENSVGLNNLDTLQTLILDKVVGIESKDIATISNLTFLQLSDTDIGLLSNLEGLIQLVDLLLIGVRANHDLNFIGSLPGLRRLDIEGISNNTELLLPASIFRLTQLSIKNATLNNLGFLTSLSNIQSLSLINIGLSSLGSITGLITLNQLTLANNDIIDVSGLVDIISLKQLDISGNPNLDCSRLDFLKSFFSNLDVISPQHCL
ncbi:MAG: hypothetical protein AAGB12_01320 [Pseudomonadota bacterium]